MTTAIRKPPRDAAKKPTRISKIDVIAWVAKIFRASNILAITRSGAGRMYAGMRKTCVISSHTPKKTATGHTFAKKRCIVAGSVRDEVSGRVYLRLDYPELQHRIERRLPAFGVLLAERAAARIVGNQQFIEERRLDALVVQ